MGSWFFYDDWGNGENIYIYNVGLNIHIGWKR